MRSERIRRFDPPGCEAGIAESRPVKRIASCLRFCYTIKEGKKEKNDAHI
jgi:hypothetical protein